MLLDEQGEVLILEIRENDNHQVSFTALDLKSGNVLWDGLEFDENWWVGMTTIVQGVLLLHIYVDNSDPEPKGLIAFDIRQKKVCWTHNDFTYLNVQDNKVLGFKIIDQDKQYQTIDLMDGERYDVEEAQFFQSNLSPKKDDESKLETQYPLHYKEGTSYFETCKSYLYNRLHLQAVKAIEYLEVNNRIIISYYTGDDNTLVNYLLVMDSEGEILYNEIIQGNINAVGLETFFIVKNQVIFVKEKNEIFSYNL